MFIIVATVSEETQNVTFAPRAKLYNKEPSCHFNSPDILIVQTIVIRMGGHKGHLGTLISWLFCPKQNIWKIVLSKVYITGLKHIRQVRTNVFYNCYKTCISSYLGASTRGQVRKG